MAGPGAILREIHRLRRHAKDLQDEIDRLPRLLKGQQTRLAKQEQAAREAHDHLNHLKVTARQKEGDLKQAQQLILKHQDQMNSASSKKEYDAFKTEIANDRATCQRLEDEILRTMLEVDERTAQLPEVDAAVVRAREEYLAFEKESQARGASLAAQLQEAQRAIQEVEAELPPEVREQYDRQVAARGEDALTAVNGRSCTACYTEITAQNAHALLMGQFVICKSCGRILYMPA